MVFIAGWKFTAGTDRPQKNYRVQLRPPRVKQWHFPANFHFQLENFQGKPKKEEDLSPYSSIAHPYSTPISAPRVLFRRLDLRKNLRPVHFLNQIYLYKTWFFI